MARVARRLQAASDGMDIVRVLHGSRDIDATFS
jgi:plasmid stabilization system protein ParE